MRRLTTPFQITPTQSGLAIILRAVIPLMLFFTGCSLLGTSVGFVEPELELVEIRIKEAKLLQTVLEFEIRIDNDNPDPLYISGGSQKIYLNGEYLGKGFLTDSMSIPAFGRTQGKVDLYVSNLALIGKLLPILEAESLQYRIDSNLVIGEGLSSRRVNLKKEDTFRFSTPLDTRSLRPMS